MLGDDSGPTRRMRLRPTPGEDTLPPCAPRTRGTTPILPPPRSHTAARTGPAPLATAAHRRPRQHARRDPSTPAATGMARPPCGWPERSVSSGGSPATSPTVAGSRARSARRRPCTPARRTAPRALTFVARLDTQQGSTPELVRILEEAAEDYRSSGDHDGAKAVPTALLAHELYRQGRRQRRPKSWQWRRPARRPVGLEPSAQMLSRRDGQHERRPAPGGAPAHDTALATFRDLGDPLGDGQNPCGGWVDLAHIREARHEQALHALDEGVELAAQLGNTEQTIHLQRQRRRHPRAHRRLPRRPSTPRGEAPAPRPAARALQSEIAFIRNGSAGLCARRPG